MKLYEKCFRWYGSIPDNNRNHSRLENKIYSALRFISRIVVSKFYFPFYYKRGKKTDVKTLESLVVSLTSFPARLNTLWLTIESIKHQNVLPKKIVLYLIEEEVTRERVPQSLLNEEDSLFEIRFRNGKLRAHGKYHFAMKDFPDSIIVTVDDDMIYPDDTIESLWNAHKQYPNCVITNNTHQILSEKGMVKSYSEWRNISKCDDIIELENLIPMGVGGALYPPHLLYKDVLDFKIAKELSYFADDLWLYAMAKLANIKVIKSKFNFLSIIPIDISENISLTSINNGNNQNDVQFNNIRNYYLNKVGVDIAK